MIKDVDFGRTQLEKDQVKYIISRLITMKCLFCRGIGHFASECTTKKIADTHSKHIRNTCEWGAMKSYIRMKNQHRRNDIYNYIMSENVIRRAIEYNPN